MSHSHGHGHSHGHEKVSGKGLLWAVVLNMGLTVFEVVAGIISGSIALLADALHNFNDAAALLIAYIARKISRKEADERYTFGYKRAELIGAMINLTALIMVGLYLTYEAIRRILEPQPLQGAWIMGAAGLALVVDVATAWLLWAMSKGSMNVKAAFVHNLTDAAASLAVLIGGAAIYWLDWNWVDPALTIAIAGYILYISQKMLRRTASILMEGTPEDLDPEELCRDVEGVEGVTELHHLHVWELDEERRALEAHIVLDDGALERMDEVKDRVKKLLEERYHIHHSTLEFESFEECCRGHAGRLIPRH